MGILVNYNRIIEFSYNDTKLNFFGISVRYCFFSIKNYIINGGPRKFVYLKKVHRLLIFHDKFLHFLIFPINIELKNIENQIFHYLLMAPIF